MNEKKKHSILIVDDENSNIIKLTNILSPDYIIYVAKNGANAIKAAEKYLPDVILLDIIMPDMDGYDVIAVLKGSEKTKSIPVLFITGLSDADDEEKGLALGAADYLTKPFSTPLVKLRVLHQIKLIEQFRTNEYDIVKYKLANDALHIALWDMDVVNTDPINPDNRLTWSREFRHMLGFSDEDDFPNVLHSWSDRLHPDDKEMTLNAFAAHMNDYSGQTPYDIESRLRLKDGTYRHFHALGTTFRDKDGIPIRVAGSLMDITKKKRMEQENADFIKKIEADAHWYKSILDAIPLPVTVTDADMNWTFVNKAVEDFLGVKLEDIRGTSCKNWNSEICDTDKCGIAYAKRGLKRTFFNHKDLSYQVDIEILRDMGGEVAGFIEVMQDITGIQQLANQRAEAEISSKAKSAFLANMSHEIRTPMNAIWGIIEILMQDRTLPEETMEGLGRIHSSCNLLLGIINDILDLSKIEAGKLDIMPSQYEVASLINDAIQLNIMRLGDKNITFEIEIDENIPARLIGDELRIKQILNNLLSNAFKYTDNGKVTLSGSFEHNAENGILILSVRDTGHGMTKEQVDRLFDEYSRFNQETGRAIEGTGLGMAITHHLLSLMGGKIHVESELEKGSLFTVRLPQNTVDNNVLGEELADNLRNFQKQNYITNTKTNGKSSQVIREHMPYGTVLIVDDVETNLYVAKGLMKSYGLKIDTVMSGSMAIDIIERGNAYDIIFMDHMMPVMDGIETTKRLRDLGYLKPIVALTANAIAGQADIFLENGFNDFISKPIDIRRLNSVLNKLIRDKQPPEVLEEARRQTRTAETNVNGGQKTALLIESFVRDARRASELLEGISRTEFEIEENLRKFIITVHGIKSALANIGETNLSELAYKLEIAGNERNLSLITDISPGFLRELRVLLDKYEVKQDSGDADEDIDELRNKLMSVQKMCLDYNRKGALDILEEINKKSHSRETHKIVDCVKEFLLISEFENAENAVANYMSDLLSGDVKNSIKEVSEILNNEIAGINIAKGLERYDGDEETYLRILRSYAASVRSVFGIVENAGKDNLKNYEITVHGIKGASYDIFADSVGEQAKALEMAAKSEDLSYIDGHNVEFLEAVQKLVGDIEDMLSAINAEIKKPEKDKPSEEDLLKLLSACGIYDMSEADAVMAEIEKYQYYDDGGLAVWLRENVDLINFSQIVEKLSYLENLNNSDN